MPEVSMVLEIAPLSLFLVLQSLPRHFLHHLTTTTLVVLIPYACAEDEEVNQSEKQFTLLSYCIFLAKFSSFFVC